MKSGIILLMIGFLLSTTMFGQAKSEAFKITGFVEGLDTGWVQVLQISSGEKFREIVFDSTKVRIGGGHFNIAGKTTYPHPVRLMFQGTGANLVTENLFICKGEHSLQTHVDSIKDEVPFLSNSPLNDEYKYVYRSRLDSAYAFLHLFDSLSQQFYREHNGKIPPEKSSIIKALLDSFYKMQRAVIIDYIKSNPSSYISLWKLVERVYSRTSFEENEALFASLSPELKATTTGVNLSEALKELKLIRIGGKFPEMILSTKMNKTESIHASFGKYTLVDFWFSYCSPCIAEFPKLRELYNEFGKEGFEIIGISVDGKKAKGEWLKAIDKHSLSWKQFWDADGINTHKLYISSFPTNFLLDETGKIVAKNIKPDQLKALLQKNIKTN